MTVFVFLFFRKNLKKTKKRKKGEKRKSFFLFKVRELKSFVAVAGDHNGTSRNGMSIIQYYGNGAFKKRTDKDLPKSKPLPVENKEGPNEPKEPRKDSLWTNVDGFMKGGMHLFGYDVIHLRNGVGLVFIAGWFFCFVHFLSPFCRCEVVASGLVG